MGSQRGERADRTLELLATELLLVEGEELGREDVGRRLVVGVVVRLEVGVCERVLDRDALLRVEGEASVDISISVNDLDVLVRSGGRRYALLQQVDRKRVRVGVDGRERLALLEGQRAQVVARAVRRDGVEVVERGCAKHVQDQRQLVVIYIRDTASQRGA